MKKFHICVTEVQNNIRNIVFLHMDKFLKSILYYSQVD
jgi:hypothetical protein